MEVRGSSAILALTILATASLLPAQPVQTKYDHGTSLTNGLYGPPKGKPSAGIAPAADPAKVQRVWEGKPFYVIQTDLCPAWLIQNAADRLVFFNDLSSWGLGGPSHFAFAGKDGVKTVKAGGSADGQELAEAWVLAWFSGSEGWTNWDVPWLIVLQHRPAKIELTAAGLDFRFPGKCGYVAAMPLYGYFKPPAAKEKDLLEQAGLKSKGVRTWEWASKLPGEVIERCRWWAAATRFFPTYCRETFSVDPGKDRLTIKQEFTWLQVEDDWKTKGVKFAPLPPTLGLALYGKTFPMTISENVHDPWYVTPYGPLVGVLDKDAFTIDMNVLQYVHETESQQPPNVKDAGVAAAVKRLQDAMRGKFAKGDGGYGFDHGEGNFVWASMSDCWYPKALAYMDDNTRANAMKSLKNYFDKEYLQQKRYVVDSTRKQPYYVAFGPGCWDGKHANTDSGKLATARLYTMWAYAHYAGDWDLIRQRWDLVRWSFSTETTMTWKTVGREAIAEMGDEAPPAMALARLAYRAGEIDTYLYACYIFAKELVHHYVKQMGAQYFRENQPMQSMEVLPEHVHVTNLWGETAGWQIDGPAYPAKTGERQYNNRWVRFQSEDVARFHRETMHPWLVKELDYYQNNPSSYKRSKDDAHIAPSQIRLRSMLLDETPDQLCKLAPPETWQGNAGPVGMAAIALSVIRTGQPAKYDRLVPAGEPYPFVTGLERDKPREGVTIVIRNLADRAESKFWPVPNWFGWKAPKKVDGYTGKRESFCFGQITPALGKWPTAVVPTAWNWVTNVVAYEFE